MSNPSYLRRFSHATPSESSPIQLTQKRIYILPTRNGVILAIVLFAMLMGAINYNNSLTYLLTFLLISVAAVSMLHTWRNLYGLHVDIGKCTPVHVGSLIEVPVSIQNTGTQTRLALNIAWPEKEPIQFDLKPNELQWVKLTLPTDHRGYQPIGKLTIYSQFPLGLFHAWSHLQFEQNCLVYAYPAKNGQLPNKNSPQDGNADSGATGSDDFVGQRNYNNGDSLRHINWKALAKEQGLLTKQFSGNQSDELVLSWDQTGTTDTEQCISQLTRWVIEAEQAGLRYGLHLPDQHLPTKQGHSHRHQCLSALALYRK